MEKFCAEHAAPMKEIDESTALFLKEQNWPGNVRQLENAVQRAAALSNHNILHPKDFETFSNLKALAKDDAHQHKHSIKIIREDGHLKSFKELQHEIFEHALKHFEGNMTQTAKALGIAKSTLYANLIGNRE